MSSEDSTSKTNDSPGVESVESVESPLPEPELEAEAEAEPEPVEGEPEPEPEPEPERQPTTSFDLRDPYRPLGERRKKGASFGLLPDTNSPRMTRRTRNYDFYDDSHSDSSGSNSPSRPVSAGSSVDSPIPFPIRRSRNVGPTRTVLGPFPWATGTGTPVVWSRPVVEDSRPQAGATVTAQGIICLTLHNGISVDLTVDKGIRVLNDQSKIIMGISPDGHSAALIHPSGQVYAYGSRVETCTTDRNGNLRYAKMFYKGITFSSDACALVYLVDSAGTRTTSDVFSDLSGDITVPVFLDNAHFGPEFVQESTKIVRQADYWITDDGTENWVLNGIRISQTPEGLVRIFRSSNRYLMRTSPKTGTAFITTPSVHSTASISGGPPGPNSSNGPHLFVKREERRLHSDGKTFICRNAGHAAGFDDNNLLKVF